MIDRILQELKSQRERLDKAINALEGAVKGVLTGSRRRRGRPRRGGRRHMTAAGRKRLSEMMKKRWAARKKQGRKRL